MKTVRNVLSNWTAFVLGTAITFVLSPFVVHHLGASRYGLWAVIGSVVGYLGLLDLGVRVGVTRFVARYAAQAKQDALNRVVSTALALFIGAGLLAAMLAAFLALLLPRFVDVPAEFQSEASAAISIAGVTVAIALIGGVYGGVIAGVQRFAVINALDVTAELLRAAGVVAVLSRGGGLVGLAVVQLAVVSLRGMSYTFAARRLQPGLHASCALFDVDTLRAIVRFSGYTTILHILGMMIFQSDAVVIAAIMPVSQVTLFVIAGNLCQAALQVLGGMSRALFPLVSARQAIEGLEGSTVLLRDGMRLSTLVFLPIVITFLTRGPTFIGLWMGPQFARDAGYVLQVLALGLCVFASYQVLNTCIMALDLHRGLIPGFIAEALANLSLSVILGRKFGVSGVAWGTTLPRILISLAFGPWYARRKLALGIGEYAIHAWVRPFLSLLPFAVASVAVDRTWAAANLGMFFLQVVVLLPLAALGIWLAGLVRGERALVRANARLALARAYRLMGGGRDSVQVS
jgi:O-antigen/teichoic acid export membrane protein